MWFGSWFGGDGGSSSGGNGGGGGTTFPPVTSATTIELVRDRAIAVIAALVPRTMPRSPFVAYRNEGPANFQRWANGNPLAAFRRYQVRTSDLGGPPLVSNSDNEQRTLQLTAMFAYPQDGRAGPKQALSRDDVGEQDRFQIEFAIGLYGAANFAGSYPNACWLPSPAPRWDAGAACDFLVIVQNMMYTRIPG